MKRNLIIFITTIVVVVVAWMYINSTSTVSDEQQEQNYSDSSNTDLSHSENQSTQFINGLFKNLPESYIISDVAFFEYFHTGPTDARAARPCDHSSTDPTQEPLCFTKMTIYEDIKTKSIDDYIENDDKFAYYQDVLKKQLVKQTYQETIPYVYTSEFFNCPGTGAESCNRKKFIYHLSNGSNIAAFIDYSPYRDDERVGMTPEVQKVVNIYEDLLTQTQF